ncbi:hypothetical protein D030_1805A, partial [Vibrio parahaemolyticus AQ3810]
MHIGCIAVFLRIFHTDF